MTNVTSVLVSELEEKLNKLIGRHKDLIEKTRDLETGILGLKKIIGEQKAEIIKLQEQYKILKLSKTIESNEGAVEAKTKINELVREIDKCIGLLNT